MKMILDIKYIKNENQKDEISLNFEVNIYNIHPILANVPNIRIIDIPGFGDTIGLDSIINVMIIDIFINEFDYIACNLFLYKIKWNKINFFSKI